MLSNEIIIIDGEDSISSSGSDIDEFMESIEDLIEKNKYLEKNVRQLEMENKILSKQIHQLQNELHVTKQQEQRQQQITMTLCALVVLLPCAMINFFRLR
jgi:septal ring factor EnvC (AmiA/AmiB activator)